MSSEDLQIIESRRDLEAAIKVLSGSPNYIPYDCFNSNGIKDNDLHVHAFKIDRLTRPNSESQKFGYHQE